MPKRLKKLQKIFTWFTILSLVLQMGSGAFLYRPVFAEETTPPETVVEETTTPDEEPAPVEEEAPAEPVDEAPAEEPPAEEPIEEPLEEPTEEVVEEPVLTVEQEEVVEETPEEVIVEEEPIEEPALDLEEPEVAEESAELNPSVFTDKEDYAPGETVKISGENFPINTILIIRVTRPDGSVVKGDGSFEEGNDEVTSDEEGRFEYHYQLNGIEGEYLVEVLLGATVLATTTFTDNPGGYSVQLTSPTPPTSSSSFTWTISGFKPEPGQEISHIEISGCWSYDEVSSVSTSPNGHVVEIQASGLVKVEGLSDGDLPLDVTINFNLSFPSNGSATVFIKTGGGPDGGGPDVGFDFATDGPNCEIPDPYCGDGNVDPGEECDDGNSKDGDGCSANCQIEGPGSITVCKVIIDPDGNVVDGSAVPGATFSISGITPDPVPSPGAPAGEIGTSTFTTPLTFNGDIFSFVERNDAECVTYDGLALGGYYYGEESTPASGWKAPKYNDQFQTPVSSTASFFEYSGELFDSDPSNDGNRNTDADGHVVLSGGRPHRTLVILNQYEELLYGSIQGRKYRDVNGNGDFDQEEKDEPGDPNRLDGWHIYLYDTAWTLVDEMDTGDDTTPAGNVGKGQYRFVNVEARNLLCL